MDNTTGFEPVILSSNLRGVTKIKWRCTPIGREVSFKN